MSAFSLDTALLIERNEHFLAGVYVLASVVVSIAGLFLGLMLVRQLA
jgi:CrcB protein